MVFKTSLLVSTMLAGVLAAGAAYASTADAAQPPPGAPSAGTPGVSPPGVTPGVGAGTSTRATGASQQSNRQEAGATAETAKGSDSLISEIVVTAEKREASLQQVPVAVSAFTAEKRDLVGIQSVVDQTNYTPGLTYQPSLDRLSLRGVGRLSNAHSVDSGTAIYVDGAFTTSTFEAGRDPLFVERTEILRGPQGTLYGRNAIGGAYNVISKLPTKELSGEARVTFQNYDHEEVAGMISGPLTDWLRFSVGYGKTLQSQGFIRNVSSAPGLRFATTDGVKDQDHFQFMLAGELGKLDFVAYYGKEQWNDSAPPGTVTNGGTLAPDEINPYFGSGSLSLTPIASFGFTGGLNTQYFGPLRTGSPARVAGPFVAETNVAFKNTLHETDVARTHLTYHFDNFDVKYIGAFTRYNYFYTNDTDQTSVTSYQIPLTAGSPCANLRAANPALCQPLTVFPSVTNTYNEDEEFYSHEFNIASTWDSPLQYIAGLYYYHEKFQYPIDIFQKEQPQLNSPLNAVTMTAAAPNPSRTLLHNNTFFSVSSKAAFAQVDYKIFRDFKLTGGLRYTSDEKKGIEEQRAVCFALPQCGTNPSTLGSLIGGAGIPALGVPAVPGSVDITLAQSTLTAAQLGTLLTTGRVDGRTTGQQGVVAYTYDASTGYLRRQLADGWNDVTGTAGIEWTPDRKTLAYLKYSRGYKSGAFATVNGTNGTFSQAPYALPEQADDFEGGLKKDWTRRIQTNITGFYERYYNAQYPLTITQSQGPNVGIFYNIPRSTIQGVELETVFAPLDHLNILFTYAYLDAHIDKGGPVTDPNDPTATQPGAKPTGAVGQGIDTFTGLPTRGQDLKGNALPLSPKNKLSLNVNYTLDLGRFGTLIPSASYIWRDQQYSAIFNRSYNLSPSTDQVDLRLTYKEPKNRFEIIGYARNVTNNVNYETLSGTRYSTSQVYQTYVVQDPRTYGVQFQARF